MDNNISFSERMDEYEISIKDMMFRVCTKWRQMLAAFVVVAALFGVTSAVKSYQSVETAKAALAEQKKNGGPQEGEELVVVPEFVLVNPKNILLGGCVGAIVVAAVYVCGYVMSTKLKSEDDIESLFGVHSIASFVDYSKQCKKDSKIDNKIVRVFYKEASDKEKIQMAITDIAMTMNQKGYDSVCFISSGTIDSDKINKLVSKLSSIVKVEYLDSSILTSAKDLQKFTQFDSVVIVEKMNESKYEDINRELEYCSRFSVPIIGSIIIC